MSIEINNELGFYEVRVNGIYAGTFSDLYKVMEQVAIELGADLITQDDVNDGYSIGYNTGQFDALLERT